MMTAAAERGKQATITGLGQRQTLAEGRCEGMARSWAVYVDTPRFAPVAGALADCTIEVEWGSGGVSFSRSFPARAAGVFEGIHAEFVKVYVSSPAAWTVAAPSQPTPAVPLVVRGALAECPSFDGGHWSAVNAPSIAVGASSVFDVPGFASKVCVAWDTAQTVQLAQLDQLGAVVSVVNPLDAQMSGRPIPLHAKARFVQVFNDAASAAAFTPMVDFWVP